MVERVEKTTKTFLLNQVRQDPGLPRPQPTTSFWQLPPHPTLSEKQSPQLPSKTDVAIIGSGITGCSLAKHILDISAKSSTPDTLTVTVFEARTLTSGATGRNGGLLTSCVPEEFTELCEQYGRHEAVKMARFVNRNLEMLYDLASSRLGLEKECQVRRLLDIICYSDHETFIEAKESWTLYEELVPEDRGKTQFLTSQEAEQKYNFRAPAGAVAFPNGACWPYRLITNIWSQIYEKYNSQLSIETQTPVENITYDANNASHPYTLHTPRGLVQAAKVIHATNGYAGHLIPRLRGPLYPLRGTMSVQKSTPSFGQHGDRLTWSMTNNRVYDPEADTLEAGTYYAHQNPVSGDIFIGGEKTKLSDFFVTDDTEVNAHCAENFATLLPRYFIKGWGGDGPDDEKRPEIRSTWTGIMGFTGDRLPLVGPLSQSTTQRGDGEWIVAGFSGYGMSLCWACGEAVANMVLGMDVSDVLPAPFLATKKRIEEPDQRGPLDAVLDMIADQVSSS